MPDQPIYLDYNATTPIKHEVAEAMRPFLFEHFGNPSSSHAYGAIARAAVDTARAQVAELLGCSPAEIIFTSGGTEANNTAIKGVAHQHRARGRHIITSAVEHPAVSAPCAYLGGRGWQITTLPVDAVGRVDPAAVAAAITDDTVLISIMHANNEVGTLQPLREIADIAHARGVLLHTDAAQSVGKVPVLVDELGADLLSVAGHKLYAPKGVGALYARAGVDFTPLMHGAGHEAGRRPGTENVLEIVGLGQAAAIAARNMENSAAHMRALRDQLYAALRAGFPETVMRRNGPEDGRLPNTLSVSFRGIRADTLLDAIQAQVAVSAGAACHGDTVTISHVLAAMGVPDEFARGTLRFSVGVPTTPGEVDEAAAILIPTVWRLLPHDDDAS